MALLRILVVLGLAVLLGPGVASADAPPANSPALAAATRILDAARSEAAKGCENPPDVLVKVLCERRLQVGLRTYYPGFSVRDDHGVFRGFEPDIARRIAAFLGVGLEPVAVDAKSRVPLLADGHIDLVIATMGHTVQRSDAVRFIRPHYYVSQTAVVGSNAIHANDWVDLAGHTVCLPLGSNSNLDFIRHHIRVLTFDRPEQLLDVLQFNECAFIVQDDTFFAQRLADPAWSARFGIKFRFSPLPWGMAVAHGDARQFAALLDDLSAAFHANGTFLELARANQLDLSFLETEQAKWRDPGCLTADGAPQPSCLTPPVNSADPTDTSPVAPYVARLQHWLADWFGVSVDLSLVRNRSTFDLLLEGISYTLILIVGTQLSTMVIALGFARLMTGGALPIRRAIGALTAVGQVTPLPLLIFFVYVLAGGLARYSGPVAIVAAVLAIGLYNGSNAARAIDEAHQALLRHIRSISDASGYAPRPAFVRAVSLASVQLVAFLINAAKGSPAAGMIGVPDFLNVVTDVTASSQERITMYLILLIFYGGLVTLVIVLLSTLRRRLVGYEAGHR